MALDEEEARIGQRFKALIGDLGKLGTDVLDLLDDGTDDEPSPAESGQVIPLPVPPKPATQPDTERAIVNREDVVLPPGADPTHYLGALTGDRDPAHNWPLPAGTTWADGTPYVGAGEAPVGPAKGEPIPTAPAHSQGLDIRKENDTDWLSHNWLNNIKQFVHDDSASEEGTSLFILYDAPNRDNGNWSAGGASGLDQYKPTVDAVSDGIGDDLAAVIVEPDALGLISALPLDLQTVRYDCLQYAATKFHTSNPNTKVYVDASMWVPVDEMAARLRKVRNIDGFSINVSGWEDLPTCYQYGDALARATGLTYIIDTSRNGAGNPHKPAWCNVTDTRVGHMPTIKTESKYCDALVWAKVPGESDGKKINGWDGDGKSGRADVPNAGEPWPDFKEAILSGRWDSFKAKYGA